MKVQFVDEKSIVWEFRNRLRPVFCRLDNEEGDYLRNRERKNELCFR